MKIRIVNIGWNFKKSFRSNDITIMPHIDHMWPFIADFGYVITRNNTDYTFETWFGHKIMTIYYFWNRNEKINYYSPNG